VAISAIVNVDMATLLENNPNVDSGCTNIYPGEVGGFNAFQRTELTQVIKHRFFALPQR
jgi:hypothetical protein